MKAEKLSDNLTEGKVKMRAHTSFVITDTIYQLNFNTQIHRKPGSSSTAAHQINLNSTREICIFMYKITSVEGGGLSRIALRKLFVFV